MPDVYNRWPYWGNGETPGPGTVGQKIDVAEVAWRVPQFWGEPWRSGMLMGRTGRALRALPSVAHGALGLTGLDLAASAAFAPRGRMVEKMAGSIGGQGAALVGGGIGMALAGPAGAIVGAILADPVGRSFAESGFATAMHTARVMRNIQTGGDYVDTPLAYTQRQRALIELSSSLLNARQYLGKEGLLFHQ